MSRPPSLSVSTTTGLALVLRPMVAEDLARVVDIEQQAHSHPWRQASFETRLRLGDDCWVASEGGDPVAYAVVSSAAGDAELLNIAVSSGRQRQGIARVLLEHLIARAAASAENLFLEVRVSNRPAIAFYQGLDFVEVGCRPNYYPAENGREDALIMSRVLGS